MDLRTGSATGPQQLLEQSPRGAQLCLLASSTVRFLLWIWASWTPASFESFLQKETWGAQCLGLSAAWGKGC